MTNTTSAETPIPERGGGKGQCEFSKYAKEGSRCTKKATRKFGDHWFCDEHGSRDFAGTRATQWNPLDYGVHGWPIMVYSHEHNAIVSALKSKNENLKEQLGMSKIAINGLWELVKEKEKQLEKWKACACEALNSFKITQTPKDYPVKHWSNRVLQLKKESES